MSSEKQESNESREACEQCAAAEAAVPSSLRHSSPARGPVPLVFRPMLEVHNLPSFFVLPTTGPSTPPSSSAAAAFRNGVQGVVAVSSHWGTPRVLVDIEENVIARKPEDPRSRLLRLAASRDLAERARRLLRLSGLTQCDEPLGPDTPARRLSFGDVEFLPPVIRVSIPAHFGVDLLLLAGAALRPLTEKPVLFVAMGGGVDATLRNQFDSSNLDALRRFANRFPKRSLVDLYPLFLLIGASFGVDRGVLDRLFESAPAPPHQKTRVPSRGQDEAIPLAGSHGARPVLRTSRQLEPRADSYLDA